MPNQFGQHLSKLVHLIVTLHTSLDIRNLRHPDRATDAILTRRQSWSRVPVCPFTFVCLCLDGLHDLILALELLLVLKAVRVLSFSGTTNHYTTDICLCLMTRGQQRSAQI